MLMPTGSLQLLLLYACPPLIDGLGILAFSLVFTISLERSRFSSTEAVDIAHKPPRSL